MATTVIFADFSIYDKEKAAEFVEALVRSANGPKFVRLRQAPPLITDIDNFLNWTNRQAHIQFHLF